MTYLFNLLLYQPLFNALVFLYDTIAFGDLGISIIILTLIIRLLLYPLFYRGMHHQAVMQRLQPEIKRIQDTHKNDRTRQGEAMMALWKEHRINPFSGFLMILIQLPVLFAVFKLFQVGVTAVPTTLFYPFIEPVASFNTMFLGLINLSDPNILIVAIAALLQYVQARAALATAPKPVPGAEVPPAARMARQMAFIGPILIFVFFYRLPAAVSLYLLVSTAFSVFQQFLINRSLTRTHGTVPTNPAKSA